MEKSVKKREPAEVIRTRLEACDPGFLPAILAEYADDPRKGVAKLVRQFAGKYEKLAAEEQRLERMLEYERKYGGCTYIAGVDEAGRGPLAGPVVAAAVILPEGLKITYLDDSKKLTAVRREELFEQIMEQAVSVGVGQSSSEVIDQVNILQATFLAMKEAVGQLSPPPELLLNDAVTIPGVTVSQVPIIGGDGKSLSIAAASVIAKVTRDRLMAAYDSMYPVYGFAEHKGYGSRKHIEALKEAGPCPIHRRSFIRKFFTARQEEER